MNHLNRIIYSKWTEKELSANDNHEARQYKELSEKLYKLLQLRYKKGVD